MGSGWSFTRFYLQLAVDGGYDLTEDAQLIWTIFEKLHNKAGIGGTLEIPMESFTRAVEIVLKDGEPFDAPKYHPPAALWEQAIRNCGYTQVRIATSRLKLAVLDRS